MSPTQIKFESSPTESLADSFISTPGTSYPSLFSDTMEHEVMTPQSFDDDSMFGGSVNGSTAGTPGPEKKSVKKRKSWGQQLPEPKTNLPPRKRAKTEDEKEQRRVERVLRNRRAAQSSRERKRLEVEALEAEKHAIERRNADLEMQLQEMHTKNLMLQRQLEVATGGNMTVFRGSNAPSPAHTEQLRRAPSPVTFSHELFSSRDSTQRSSMSTLESPTTLRTVNPASLSPEMRPVTESTNASSSDMTQHPAVSVGRATALDDLSAGLNSSDHSSFGSDSIHYNFEGYFNQPEPTESDNYLLENGIGPITDSFDLENDYLDFNDNSLADDFNINEFLHHDENNQPAPKVQSSDSLAESTASLQPQFGASTHGCDDGGNAVSV